MTRKKQIQFSIDVPAPPPPNGKGWCHPLCPGWVIDSDTDKVERCDDCERFKTDSGAFRAARKLGYIVRADGRVIGYDPEPFFWTLLVPPRTNTDAVGPTEWHSREGHTLTRGAFKTWSEARKWGREQLGGKDWKAIRIWWEGGDSEDYDNAVAELLADQAYQR